MVVPIQEFVHVVFIQNIILLMIGFLLVHIHSIRDTMLYLVMFYCLVLHLKRQGYITGNIVQLFLIYDV